MNEQNSHNDDEKLKKEAPLLFGMKKEEPFEAPAGYFEKFQVELSEKIHSKKKGFWSFFLKPVVWAPSLIVLIMTGFYLFSFDDEQNGSAKVDMPTYDLDGISFEAIDSYVSNHLLASINTDEIIDMVGVENIVIEKNHTVENKSEVTPSIEHIDDAEMEDYLMENIDELEIY